MRAKRWSRIEYERLVDLGVFRPGERLELVGGALLVREPQGSRHATAIQAVQEALRAALGPGWVIRTQMPVALDDESEPEPDVSAVPGSFRDYSHGHPSRPALLVRSPSRAWISTARTRAVSTPAPACRSTGS